VGEIGRGKPQKKRPENGGKGSEKRSHGSLPKDHSAFLEKNVKKEGSPGRGGAKSPEESRQKEGFTILAREGVGKTKKVVGRDGQKGKSRKSNRVDLKTNRAERAKSRGTKVSTDNQGGEGGGTVVLNEGGTGRGD